MASESYVVVELFIWPKKGGNDVPDVSLIFVAMEALVLLECLLPWNSGSTSASSSLVPPLDRAFASILLAHRSFQSLSIASSVPSSPPANHWRTQWQLQTPIHWLGAFMLRNS